MTIPSFNMSVEDNKLTINGKAIAILGGVTYTTPETSIGRPRWNIKYTPLNDDGSEGNPVSLVIRSFTEGKEISFIGIEEHRQMKISIRVNLDLIRKCVRITGNIGPQRIYGTVKNISEAVTFVFNHIR